jgi:Hint domain
VPIEHLINGASIARVPMDQVEYWHIELDAHDVILANNLPAESYLDMNNRDFFVERGIRPYQPSEPVHPVVHEGAVVAAAREQLRARAARLGWTQDRDPAPMLEIDGIVHAPVAPGPLSVFLLPRDAKSVRLLSRTFVPADLEPQGGDPRTLGLSLQSLKLVGRTKIQDIPLDTLDTPYPVETEGDRSWRWTDGALTLSSDLWAGFEEPTVALHVAYDATAVRGYVVGAAAAGTLLPPASLGLRAVR